MELVLNIDFFFVKIYKIACVIANDLLTLQHK